MRPAAYYNRFKEATASIIEHPYFWFRYYRALVKTLLLWRATFNIFATNHPRGWWEINCLNISYLAPELTCCKKMQCGRRQPRRISYFKMINILMLSYVSYHFWNFRHTKLAKFKVTFKNLSHQSNLSFWVVANKIKTNEKESNWIQVVLIHVDSIDLLRLLNHV